jgi:5-methylcytosine-specific restriction endonuclease McrA
MANVPILRCFHDIKRELLRAPPVLTAERIGFIQSPAFTRADEWARLRYDFLRDHEARCQCCGRGQGRKINVDHIYPRRSHPQFALTYANLQVLCSTCNKGKGNRDRTDWRFRRKNPPAPKEPEIPPCPACHTPMKLRSSARGAFWGCSRFPDCRGTRPAKTDAPRAGRGPRRRPHRSTTKA